MKMSDEVSVALTDLSVSLQAKADAAWVEANGDGDPFWSHRATGKARAYEDASVQVAALILAAEGES